VVSNSYSEYSVFILCFLFLSEITQENPIFSRSFFISSMSSFLPKNEVRNPFPSFKKEILPSPRIYPIIFKISGKTGELDFKGRSPFPLSNRRTGF